jgi:hypothetical protein
MHNATGDEASALREGLAEGHDPQTAQAGRYGFSSLAHPGRVPDAALG